MCISVFLRKMTSMTVYLVLADEKNIANDLIGLASFSLFLSAEFLRGFYSGYCHLVDHGALRCHEVQCGCRHREKGGD